jgi:hypothetical protein
VLYADRSDDPENTFATMKLARSTDGGRTWSRQAWGDGPIDPREVPLGDYLGIAAHGGRVYAAWVAPAVGEPPAGPSTVVDYGDFALEEGQWPAGPSEIRVGAARFA